MEEILGNIYCWFESLFGINLAEHLWGFDGAEYTKPIVYNTIGIIAFAITLFFVLAYYYIINHPRFHRWWSWLIVLVVNSTINLFVGYAWCTNDLYNGNIADNLCYIRDESGDIIEYLITESSCLGFGIANVLVTAFFFFALSMCLKWWSSNCKYSPF